jgi:hypothetical protein
MKFVVLPWFPLRCERLPPPPLRPAVSLSQLQMQVKDTNSPRPERSFSKPLRFSVSPAVELLGQSLPVKWSPQESHLTLRTACRCRWWHGDELRTLVEKNDWEGIKSAPPDPPERTTKQIRTSLMAAARAAAGSSAASFSDGSISRIRPGRCRPQSWLARLLVSKCCATGTW